MELTKTEQQELREAVLLLENPGFMISVTNRLGILVEKGMDLMPVKTAKIIAVATQKALGIAASVAIATLPNKKGKPSSKIMHRTAVSVSGGAGGFFGIPGLLLELPLSTTIMLRSIADIARAEGEDINSFETKLACLEVFALDGGSKADDEGETGYYALRSALAGAVQHSLNQANKIGVRIWTEQLRKFIAKISPRFAAVISEKAAFYMIPAMSAATGALINYIFIEHFQNIAKGHFIIRRLERAYGAELVQSEYTQIREELLKTVLKVSKKKNLKQIEKL